MGKERERSAGQISTFVKASIFSTYHADAWQEAGTRLAAHSSAHKQLAKRSMIRLMTGGPT